MAQNHHKLPKSSTSKSATILYFFTTELELKIYNLFNGVITVIHRLAFSFVFSFLFLKIKEIQRAVFQVDMLLIWDVTKQEQNIFKILFASVHHVYRLYWNPYRRLAEAPVNIHHSGMVVYPCRNIPIMNPELPGIPIE